MEVLTREAYEAIAVEDEYYTGRWNYLSVVAELARMTGPTKTIEAGCRKVQIVSNSVTIDKARRTSPTYHHDLTKTPWPIEGEWDLFIALQVWEHLEGKQEKAFKEVERLCKHAIISIPWKWSCGLNNCHTGLDDKSMLEWSGGVEPIFQIICSHTRTDKNPVLRAVFYYRFR